MRSRNMRWMLSRVMISVRRPRMAPARSFMSTFCKGAINRFLLLTAPRQRLFGDDLRAFAHELNVPRGMVGSKALYQSRFGR